MPNAVLRPRFKPLEQRTGKLVQRGKAKLGKRVFSGGDDFDTARLGLLGKRIDDTDISLQQATIPGLTYAPGTVLRVRGVRDLNDQLDVRPIEDGARDFEDTAAE